MTVRKYCSSPSSTGALPFALRLKAERELPFDRRRSRRCKRCRPADECESLRLRSTAARKPERTNDAASARGSKEPDDLLSLLRERPKLLSSGARSFSSRCEQCERSRVLSSGG